MNVWRESNRLRDVFRREANGSFSIVHRAMCACSLEANGQTLKEHNVVEKIRQLLQRTETAQKRPTPTETNVNEQRTEGDSGMNRQG